MHADRAPVHLLLLAGLVLVATVAWRGRRRRAGVRAGGRLRVPGRGVRSCSPCSPAGSSPDIVTAGPASAHATLVSTDPGEGARVEQVPAAITLEFSEGVSLGAGYARVLDSGGERVDAGTASVDGDVLTIPLRTGLPDDGYLVTYRVISADSHPVSGAYSFVVGDGELVPSLGREHPGPHRSGGRASPCRCCAGSGSPASPWPSACRFSRWSAGRAAGRRRGCAAWPPGGRSRSRAAAVGSFLFQGPYAAASGPGSLFDPSLLSATAASGAGRALLARIVLAVALAALLAPVWRRGEAPSTGRVVARRCPRRGPGDQHRRDRPPGRRARGRGSPRRSRSCTSRG